MNDSHFVFYRSRDSLAPFSFGALADPEPQPVHPSRRPLFTYVVGAVVGVLLCDVAIVLSRVFG